MKSAHLTDGYLLLKLAFRTTSARVLPLWSPFLGALQNSHLKSMARRAATLLLALSPSACQTSTGKYLHHRLSDTLDVVPVSVAWGPGLYASARATRYFGTAIGIEETSRFGWFRQQHVEPEDSAARAGTFRSSDEGALGILVDWERWGGTPPREGNVLFVVPKEPKGFGESALGSGDLLDLELELHVALVGLRAGVSPVQLADWLLGWFTVDVLNDDRSASPEARTRPESAPMSLPAKGE